MTVHPITTSPDDEEPEHLVFDVNTFTFGEIETIEEIAGEGVFAQLERGSPSVKTLVAMLYVFKKRDNPLFTLADARSMKVKAVSFETPPDPKEPAG